jgi:hypothetical protein
MGLPHSKMEVEVVRAIGYALEAGATGSSSPVDASSSRVSVATKFGSQVLPPSSENDCSTWWELGVMSDQTNRTNMSAH